MGRRSKHHSSVRVLEDLPSPEQHARKANTRDEERERENHLSCGNVSVGSPCFVFCCSRPKNNKTTTICVIVLVLAGWVCVSASSVYKTVRCPVPCSVGKLPVLFLVRGVILRRCRSPSSCGDRPSLRGFTMTM